MKALLIIILGFVSVIPIAAQPPESFKYQAVARDNAGNPLTNKTMAFRISILKGTATAGAVYIEDHQKMTNGFGLVDLEIGKGTVRAGTFSTIEWGKDLFYVKVEMDPQGGVAFQHLGTSQLLSVPYAFHAKTFESVMTDATLSGNGSTTPLKIAWQSASVGQVLKWNGAIWKPAADEIGAGVATPPAGTQGNIQFNNSGVFAADANLHWDNTSKSLGIGTATPSAGLHIKGKGFPESFIYLESESGQDAGIRLNEGGNKKWQIYSDSHSGPNGLHFVNGAGQSCMFISQSSTNVGIGSDSPSYKLDVAGALNLNNGISWGAALHCNGAQALWYDGTYFSWGYGGTYNYFADKVTIGNAANPGNYMLYVQGNAFTTGTWSTSDMRFKKNIIEIESPLEKVMNIRGVTYEYRTGEFPEYRFSGGRHAGCIAQEIEKVLPEAVLTDSNGYKSLNYSELIPLLLEAVKEQQHTIDSIRADYSGLKTKCESTEKENRLILDRLIILETMTGVKTAQR